MLEQDLRNDILVSMKQKDELAKDILRLALGEIQLRCTEKSSEADKLAIIKKLISGISTSIDAIKDDSARAKEMERLEKESLLLEKYLPKPLTQEELRAYVLEKGFEIGPGSNEGKSKGMILKAIKADALIVKLSDVEALVAELLKG